MIHLSHKGSPRILEWVADSFSRGYSWPRNRTRVSCIAGGLFTNWAIREAPTEGTGSCIRDTELLLLTSQEAAKEPACFCGSPPPNSSTASWHSPDGCFSTVSLHCSWEAPTVCNRKTLPHPWRLPAKNIAVRNGPGSGPCIPNIPSKVCRSRRDSWREAFA